jgi:hypothetical protein
MSATAAVSVAANLSGMHQQSCNDGCTLKCSFWLLEVQSDPSSAGECVERTHGTRS